MLHFSAGKNDDYGIPVVAKFPTAKRMLFAHLKRLVKVGNGNEPVIPKLSLTVCPR